MIKYILSTSPGNSRTWVINLRHIAKIYQREDPLSCLQKDAPEKSKYKEAVITTTKKLSHSGKGTQTESPEK